MAKQQRQNAPDADKATGANDQSPAADSGSSPEAAQAGQNAPDADKATGANEGAAEDCPRCVALKGERPCSLECFVAAGYPAEAYEKRFGALPPAAVAAVAPDGMKRCRAITTCLVRGMPEYAGAEFWLHDDQAERLEGKGALEIIDV